MFLYFNSYLIFNAFSLKLNFSLKTNYLKEMSLFCNLNKCERKINKCMIKKKNN